MDQDTEGRGHFEDRDRRWNYAAPSQEHTCYQKLEKIIRDPSLEVAEAAWPCQHHDCALLASKTMGQSASVVLNQFVVLFMAAPPD